MEILEKEDNKKSLLEYDSDSSEPMQSRIADFHKFDILILKKTTTIHSESPEGFESFMDNPIFRFLNLTIWNHWNYLLVIP